MVRSHTDVDVQCTKAHDRRIGTTSRQKEMLFIIKHEEMENVIQR